MPSTAWKSPAQVNSLIGDGTGTIGWVNTTNAIVSDDVYSTATLAISETSRYLVAFDFDFATDLPPGAVIQRIYARSEGKLSTITPAPSQFLKLARATGYGSNHTVGGGFGLTDLTRETDDTASGWGLSDLTTAQVRNSSFGFAHYVVNGLSACVVSMDAMAMKIDWAYPAGNQAIFI
jgi:hypothetical protein